MVNLSLHGIPIAAVRINTSSVLIWFALLRVVSMRIQASATGTSKRIELLIHTAYSGDIITWGYVPICMAGDWGIGGGGARSLGTGGR